MPRSLIRFALVVVAALAASPAPAHGTARTQYYVSLGDSYAAGFQPTGVGAGAYTRNGFAYQVPRYAAARGYDLKLVNFGCGGATTTSLLQIEDCPLGLGPGGRDYGGRTQVQAAERFLRAHRGRVALVSVSIGGNDVTGCARVPDTAGCVTAAVQSIRTNVTETARRLRRAAGRKVRIVGTTYPDVLLGLWVNGDAPSQTLAQLSVAAFQSLINPALEAAYAAAGGRFVDVTAAAGSYVPFDQTTTLFPYGTVPVAVARACELSYYCAFHDIHLRTDGYALIADLVAKQLPRRR